MSKLAQFKAIYCSGLLIPDAATVSALSLLFEKIYLPNNIEIVREFSKQFRIKKPPKSKAGSPLIIEPSNTEDDPFEGLTEQQRKTALAYLEWGIEFARSHGTLFPSLFETQLFPESEPFDVKLVKEGGPGELNTYEVSMKAMVLTGEDHQTFPRLLAEGYVPVVGRFHPHHIDMQHLDKISAKQLAALLAMKSVEMLLPRTKGVHPEIILEAREKLSNHLPPFWSSMLKLSVELKKRIEECKSIDNICFESEELVDTLVRPALIDLQNKMLKERRDWFYKILSPIQKGLRLMIGNPPLTQQQLLTNALVLSADVTMSIAENMRSIESLKQEAGLTFLLEIGQMLDEKQEA